MDSLPSGNDLYNVERVLALGRRKDSNRPEVIALSRLPSNWLVFLYLCLFSDLCAFSFSK